MLMILEVVLETCFADSAHDVHLKSVFGPVPEFLCLSACLVRSRMPPKKTPIKEEDEPDAQLLVGKRIVCPGDIFDSPGAKYRGLVTGTPNSRSKNHHTRYEWPSACRFRGAPLV